MTTYTFSCGCSCELEAARERLAAQLDYALTPTTGNDPVRSALLRRRAAILAASTWEELEEAGESA